VLLKLRRRPHAYYLCFNQINYVVSAQHALLHPETPATLLIWDERVRTLERYCHIPHLTGRPLNLLWQALRCRWHANVRLYIPHRRFGRAMHVLLRQAVEVNLLDDGLDTLRLVPKNVPTAEIGLYHELLTFADYPDPPAWARSLRITRVGHLSGLLDDPRPARDTAGFDALVVQSPGVDLTAVQALTGIAPDRTLVFAHSNPHKRAFIPERLLADQSGQWSVEKTVLAFPGVVVSGETMVTVVALLHRRVGRLLVTLDDTQLRNLPQFGGMAEKSTMARIVVASAAG
jgi:hypothetical protein